MGEFFCEDCGKQVQPTPNYKSKVKHSGSYGCTLTPNEVVCPDEENCILYQIYRYIFNFHSNQ